MSYWRHKLDTNSTSKDVFQAKILVAALGSMDGVTAYIEGRAEQLVEEWLRKYKLKISELSEAQQMVYRSLRGESRIPQETKIVIPASIKSEAHYDSEYAMRKDDSNRYKKHLFSDPGANDKTYYAALKPLQDEIIRALIAKDDLIAWYSNPSRGGERSLCIPYVTAKSGAQTYAAMYPDFIVLRKDMSTGEIGAGIVYPQDQNLPESSDKLRGMVQYSSEHSAAYRAIYTLILDDESGKSLALTLHVAETRAKVQSAIDDGVDLLTIYRMYGSEWAA